MLNNRALASDATKTGFYAGVAIKAPVIFHAWIDGSSGVTGTLLLYGSNDPRALTTPDVAAAQLIATVTFTGTGTGPLAPPESEIVYVSVPYGYFFIEISAISGTNAAISIVAGGE